MITSSSRSAEPRPARITITDGFSLTIPLAGRILIVDDSATQRMKLVGAVQHLGHDAQVAADGEQALAMLTDGDYDLVLLDLEMPRVNGFAVLEVIGANVALDGLPVIVVSALDDIDSVVRAIALGAVDYLPDRYNTALLNVRINTGLDKKWQHDREVEYLQRTAVLTAAAEKVSRGQFDPAKLGLAVPSRRNDALGTLAHVFEDMAGQIFARERRLRQQVHTLKSTLLLLATGIVLGAAMPLSRMVSELQPHPFSIALWVSLATAILGLGYAAARRRLPRMNRALALLSLWWGALNAMAFVLVFWIAQHLTGSALSIVIVCEGLIVFVIATLARVEPVSPKRLAGVATGFLGIVSLILTSGDSTVGDDWVWLVIALLVPLNFALEDLLVAARYRHRRNGRVGICCFGVAAADSSVATRRHGAAGADARALRDARAAAGSQIAGGHGSLRGSDDVSRCRVRESGRVREGVDRHRLEHARTERVIESGRVVVLHDHPRRAVPGRVKQDRQRRPVRRCARRRRAGNSASRRRTHCG